MESYAKGVTLDISRNLELLPPERTSLVTQTKTQQAGRLTAEELKIQHKTRYLSPGKGGEASSHYTGGKKGKTKGDGKKGKGDHKGTRKGKEEDKEKSA